MRYLIFTATYLLISCSKGSKNEFLIRVPNASPFYQGQIIKHNSTPYTTVNEITLENDLNVYLHCSTDSILPKDSKFTFNSLSNPNNANFTIKLGHSKNYSKDTFQLNYINFKSLPDIFDKRLPK